MEDRGDDRVGIEPQVGEDGGGGYRVGDVGLARQAFLALVGGSAEFGGRADAVDLLGGQVALDFVQQLFEPRSASAAGSSPRSEDA